MAAQKDCVQILQSSVMEQDWELHSFGADTYHICPGRFVSFSIGKRNVFSGGPADGDNDV